MELFCTDEEWNRVESREKRYLLVFRILACMTPAVFVLLCLLIRTGNARVMHGVMLTVTAVLGSAGVIVYTLFLQPARQERNHLEMLRNGEKTYREGLLTVSGQGFRIPKSVRVRPVVLETGNEEERPALLNVDERWIGRMPPDGTTVRVAEVNGYIAGVESSVKPDGQREPNRKPSRVRGFFRAASAVTPLLVMWVFFTLIFGSFVFYRITDTIPARKITLFMDGETKGEDQLAARLEEGLEDPIRMVQIHPFSYMMFGTEALKAADLFIIPDSHLEQYGEWLAPGEESILMYDPDNGYSVAGEVFLYGAGETGAEVYRLYIGAESPHLEDGLARRAAELLEEMK